MDDVIGISMAEHALMGSARTVGEQLDKYLADVHSIESQALSQLERAPAITSDSRIAAAFSRHLEETLEQKARVEALLDRRAANRSASKDMFGHLGGIGMIAFARANVDTSGKLVAHAYSYEHMEHAAYELLLRAAEAAGDEEVAEGARAISAQEKEMAGRLADLFDVAVDASLRERNTSDVREELLVYLADAHAIEQQAIQLLAVVPKLVRCPELSRILGDHLEETREQRRELEARLDARGGRPGRLKDMGMRAGALNLLAFFAAQPDRTVKLAGFVYAFEHLQIAGYELLGRVADRAGDAATAELAASLGGQERRAAEAIASKWDLVIDAAFAELETAR